MNAPHPVVLRDTHVTLSHGGGGKAMRDLIEAVFLPAFGPGSGEDQARLMDGALRTPGARLAFTSDSFVVTPAECPGGDIGKLAVCGTVHDLAVGGARPLWLSAAFIIDLLEVVQDLPQLLRLLHRLGQLALPFELLWRQLAGTGALAA